MTRWNTTPRSTSSALLSHASRKSQIVELRSQGRNIEPPPMQGCRQQARSPATVAINLWTTGQGRSPTSSLGPSPTCTAPALNQSNPAESDREATSLARTSGSAWRCPVYWRTYDDADTLTLPFGRGSIDRDIVPLGKIRGSVHVDDLDGVTAGDDRLAAVELAAGWISAGIDDVRQSRTCEVELGFGESGDVGGFAPESLKNGATSPRRQPRPLHSSATNTTRIWSTGQGHLGRRGLPISVDSHLRFRPTSQLA